MCEETSNEETKVEYPVNNLIWPAKYSVNEDF